mgnify:CR=1 FL=1
MLPRPAHPCSAVLAPAGQPFGLLGAPRDPSNRPDVVLLDAALDSRWIAVQGIELFADRGYDSRANRARCTDRGLQDRIFWLLDLGGTERHLLLLGALQARPKAFNYPHPC